MSTNRYFYDALTAFKDFSQVANLSNYHDLPSDWYIGITDVVSSTKAILEGRYKEVNSLGAATIASIINIDRSVRIPFSFGGDGATFAIPPELLEGANRALRGAVAMGREAFNLESRAALIPVSEITSSDLWLRVAKYQVSPQVALASFAGRGWDEAEKWLKSESCPAKYKINADGASATDADFTGLECRWQNIATKKDFKLALVLQSLLKDPVEGAKTYQTLIDKIFSVFPNNDSYQPVEKNLLHLSLNPQNMSREVKVRSVGAKISVMVLNFFKVFWQTLTGKFLMYFNIKISKYNWGKYKADVTANSDYKKFDGCLKMVLDVSQEELNKIRSICEAHSQEKEIVYGMQTSKHAVMTCLVFSYADAHVHFLDGSEGGYALAAKELKKKLADRNEQILSATD